MTIEIGDESIFCDLLAEAWDFFESLSQDNVYEYNCWNHS